jgi:hypothetical protein
MIRFWIGPDLVAKEYNQYLDIIFLLENQPDSNISLLFARIFYNKLRNVFFILSIIYPGLASSKFPDFQAK